MVWDFTDYRKKDLQAILNHIYALNNLGIEQDDDMIKEIELELKHRSD